MSEHTPLPWHLERPEDKLIHVPRDYGNPHVVGAFPRLCIWADSPVGPSSDCGAWKEIALVHDKANGEFIVRACNSHADLLAALEEAVPAGPTGYVFCRFCNTPDTSKGHFPDCLYTRARAAIKKALPA